MSSIPLVSVVIPTHNRAGFLAEAIESVIGQRFRDWELIVVDDGSDDDTEAAVRRFSDPRMRLHRQRQSGVSSARNAGVRLSRGPWLAFLDSDDFWMPDKLLRQLEELESRPGHRICHTEEIWIRRGKRVNPKKIHRKRGGWIYERCLRRCVVSPSSVLLHRSIFAECGVFDESFPVCEDYELWLRLACRLPFLFLPEALITKRGGHHDQLSRSRWGMDRYRVRALLKTAERSPLTPRLRALTAAEIARKAAILAAGCEKWGRREAARGYSALAELWRAGGPAPAQTAGKRALFGASNAPPS